MHSSSNPEKGGEIFWMGALLDAVILEWSSRRSFLAIADDLWP